MYVSTFTAADVTSLVGLFHDEHERTYGHKAPEEPVEIVNLRTAARGKSDLTRPERPATRPSESQGQSRDAYFGPDHGGMPTPVLSRPDLGPVPRRGPIIIEEYDATVVVPPDCSASLAARTRKRVTFLSSSWIPAARMSAP